VNQRFKVRFVMDNIDEQIDTVSRSILGLTASCARCHDHKFDPIPTSDYYAMAGIFFSTDLCAGVRNRWAAGDGLLRHADDPALGRGGDRSGAGKENRGAQKLVADVKAELKSLVGKPEGAVKARMERHVARCSSRRAGNSKKT